MKTCPVCSAQLFDDIDTCFGCMYSFTHGGAHGRQELTEKLPTVQAQSLHTQGLHGQELQTQSLHTQGLHGQELQTQSLHTQGLHTQGLQAQRAQTQGSPARDQGNDVTAPLVAKAPLATSVPMASLSSLSPLPYQSSAPRVVQSNAEECWSLRLVLQTGQQPKRVWEIDLSRQS